MNNWKSARLSTNKMNEKREHVIKEKDEFRKLVIAFGRKKSNISNKVKCV